MVTTILAEMIGHYHDGALAQLGIHHHQGRLEPEARLLVVHVAMPFSLSGLVVLGFSLERQWHFMVSAVA